MVQIELVQKEIAELEKSASIIEMGVKELITGAPKSSKRHDKSGGGYFYSYEWEELPKELEPSQQNLTRNYIAWYNSASLFIKKYIPEREAEFAAEYDGILKHIQLRCTAFSTESMIADFVKNFEIQRSILLSIPSVTHTKSLIST